MCTHTPAYLAQLCGSSWESSGHSCVCREWDMARKASSSGPFHMLQSLHLGGLQGSMTPRLRVGWGTRVRQCFLQKGHGVISVVLSVVMPVVTGPGPSHIFLFGSYTTTRDTGVAPGTVPGTC